MLDFLMIVTREPKKGLVEISPKFVLMKSHDLMIRGGDFYAVWNEEEHMWSTEEQTVINLVDAALDKFASEFKHSEETRIRVQHMWDGDSGSIDRWHKYCKKQMRDCWHSLDEKLIFSNDPPKKKDYASKRLNYPLEPGSYDAYEELIQVLYSPEERAKIEWCIGAIITGASKKLQKFIVLYGSAGTGKSTVLNIIQKLFDGYYTTFDAKALGSEGGTFSLEPFKNNPLVAIQHDGDLSRIEDNTRLNSIVSHESLVVNEKNKALYSAAFNCFLIMGTNKPVKITDAKSGILRRLIDVSPTGKKHDIRKYNKLIAQIDFELGAIAWHCKEVYEANPNAYDAYVPLLMIGATNNFYNFMVDNYDTFDTQDGTGLDAAWKMYNEYCEYSKMKTSLERRLFAEELRNYFEKVLDRAPIGEGRRIRNYYSGFRRDKFESHKPLKSQEERNEEEPIVFKDQHSLLDDILAEYPAQYANEDGYPSLKWESVKTKLKDLDTSRLHWVNSPETLVIIDFDKKDETGKKSYKLNLEAAAKWPKTYAELSKSGAGIHLHYWYKGDVSMLSHLFDEDIEVKVYSGNASLRRQVVKCNDIPIATLSSGLPLKEEKKKNMYDEITFKSEMKLREFVSNCLEKKHHGATKPEIDYLFKTLEDLYSSGAVYNIEDMEPAVRFFANSSSNNADYCYKLICKMHFKSDEVNPCVETEADSEKPIAFFDIEVFPNLFLVCYKLRGDDKPVVRMYNPKPSEIEWLLSSFRLIGFNCRKYDNIMLHVRLLGYNELQCFHVSNEIINDDTQRGRNLYVEARNYSYTDIYDFSSVKQSLKKFEIELGIHHQELGYRWDQPIPEEKWIEVASYCDNDVIATEKVFDARSADFEARCILVDIVNAADSSKEVA